MYKFSILTIALIIGAATLTSFGQTTSITKEEYKKEIKKAFEITNLTFPRRETESRPNKIDVFEAGKDEPIKTVLNDTKIREFLAKDKIRYEFKEVMTKGAIVTKRLEIGGICYNDDGRTWSTSEISCDQTLLSASSTSAKVEFFVENGTLDAKPVKIFRNINTSRVYSDGSPPYINEYLYYLDSAGRLLKVEYLTRRGEGKAALNSSTIYEYDVKIEPIRLPSAGRKAKNRK